MFPSAFGQCEEMQQIHSFMKNYIEIHFQITSFPCLGGIKYCKSAGSKFLKKIKYWYLASKLLLCILY